VEWLVPLGGGISNSLPLLGKDNLGEALERRPLLMSELYRQTPRSNARVELIGKRSVGLVSVHDNTSGDEISHLRRFLHE
jgi:hypothetical protein